MTTRRLMEELRRQRGVPSQDQTPGLPCPGATAPPWPARPADLAPRRPAPSSYPAPKRQDPSGVQRPEVAPAHDPKLLERLKASSPAKLGVGRAGLRYRTQTLLQFMADFAVAKAAVESQIPPEWIERHGYLPLQTAAESAEQFLARPDLGRRLSDESLAAVRERCAKGPDVQIIVGDGLSASAVEQNAPPMVQALAEQLQQRGRRVGTTVFVRHCRAKIMDVVGQEVDAKAGIILIGERPGLGTGDGMSAYLVFRPREEATDAEKQAISNIHRRGLSPEQAGQHAANVIEAILAQETSGVGLDLSGVEPPQSTAPARINQAHAEPLIGCGQSHGQQCESCQSGLPGEICHRDEDRPCQTGTY